MSQNYKKLHWTQHSRIKMRQYGLSETRLLNLLHNPERKEKGIVPGTVALMRTNNRSKNWEIRSPNKFKTPGEVWLMFKDTKTERKIISAWRYPGVSKPGDEIPIPKDIRKELLEMLK